MGSEIRSFKDLECWSKCRELRLFVSDKVVKLLPGSERFRLGDQLLRAARSTTANVAEGYGRYHHLDNAKFCSNARASCHEVIDHLITARDEGLLTDEVADRGEVLADEAIKILNGYIRYLQRAAQGHRGNVSAR